MVAIPILLVLAVITVMIAWALSRYVARKLVWGGRSDAETVGIALILAAAGAGWLATEWWVGLAIAVISGAALATVQQEKKRFDAASALIATHAKELAIRRSQTIVESAYGVKNDAAWQREIGFFIDRVLAPQLGRISALSPLHDQLWKEIDRAASAVPLSTNFHPGIDPIEYEHFVAETLRRHGWEARTTQASGDQGIDVLASKGPLTVAVQCKLYSKPVGNAAVQEAIAGRQYQKTTHAAVVSNATFTKAAKELAASAGVQLLHHEQLENLSDMLGAGVPLLR